MNQVRIVYSDDPGGVMPEHHGKVFAVIGPFESHEDKYGLQLAIEGLLREWNKIQRLDE